MRKGCGLTSTQEGGKEDQSDWKHLRPSCSSEDVRQVWEFLSWNLPAEESPRNGAALVFVLCLKTGWGEGVKAWPW